MIFNGGTILYIVIVLVEALRYWIGPVARTPLRSVNAAEA